MSLLKFGRAAGEGKAFADGTAPGAIHLMPSHADPLGRVTGAFKGGQKYSQYGLGTANDKAAKYTQKNTDATNSNTDATNENTEAQEEQAETYDWVATVIERAGQKTERIVNQITDYATNAFKQTKLKQQINSLGNEIKAAEDAVKEYSSYLDNFTISDDSAKDAEYKNKIMNGTLQIEEIADEQIKENISRYQEYYQKLIEAQDSVQGFNNSILEAYETLIRIPIDIAEKEVEKLSNSFDNAAAKAELSRSAMTALAKAIDSDLNDSIADGSEWYMALSTLSNDANQWANSASFQYQNAYIKDNIENLRKQEKMYRQTAQALSISKIESDKQLDKYVQTLYQYGISQSQINGELIDADQYTGEVKVAVQDYNQQLQKSIIAMNALWEVNQNLITSQLELAKATAEAGQTMMENIQTYYEAQRAYDKAKQSYDSSFRSLKESAGTLLNKSDFTKEVDVITPQIQSLRTEREKMNKELNNAVSKGYIQKYSGEWYEARASIREVDQEVVELTSSIIELYNDAMNLPLEKASKKVEKLSDALSILDSKASAFSGGGSALNAFARVVRVNVKSIENDGSKLYQTLKQLSDTANDMKNFPSYEYANQLIEQRLENLKEQNKIYRKTEQEISKEDQKNQKALESAKKALKATGIDMSKANNNEMYDPYVFGGNLSQKQLAAIDAYNVALGKANASTEALSNATKEARNAELEYAKSMVEVGQSWQSNIGSYYDAQQSWISSRADLRKAWRENNQSVGRTLTTEDYTKEIDFMQEQKASIQMENDERLKWLKDALQKGYIKKYTEEWYEAQEAIENGYTEVRNLADEIRDLKDEMREEVFYKPFEEAEEKAKNLRSALDDIQSLFAEEMLYDDNGRFTEYGLANMSIDLKEYESATHSLSTLIAKRDEIINQYKHNTSEYSQKEFEEDIREIDEEIRSVMKETDSMRRQVVTDVVNQANEELKAIQKVIDKQKERWQKQKSYYDYDRQLQQQNKEIQMLESQARAIEGITDAETKAQRARIEAQLAERRDQLQDTVQEHLYSMKVEGLDQLTRDMQENIDNWAREINGNLEKLLGVLQNVSGVVDNNLDTANSAIWKEVASFQVDGLSQSDINSIIPTLGKGDIQLSNGNILSPLPNSTLDNYTKLASMMKAPHGNAVLQPDTSWDTNLAKQITNNTSNNSTTYIDSLITVNGNLDSNTKNEVIDAMRKLYPEISSYVKTDIKKDARMAGRKS